jgi:hypothetical protein
MSDFYFFSNPDLQYLLRRDLVSDIIPKDLNKKISISDFYFFLILTLDKTR